jgi:ElaB/YqjD/DUF883 family membrane-anchored ribosome-binding protein
MGHYTAENSSDRIREDIHHTQEQLRNKCRALGSEVRSVVQHTQEMFTRRMMAAQETIDIASHVRRHPLVACGVAVAIGYVLGLRWRSRQVHSVGESRNTVHTLEPDRPMQPITPEKQSLWNALVFKGVEVMGEIVKRRFVP